MIWGIYQFMENKKALLMIDIYLLIIKDQMQNFGNSLSNGININIYYLCGYQVNA